MFFLRSRLSDRRLSPKNPARRRVVRLWRAAVTCVSGRAAGSVLCRRTPWPASRSPGRFHCAIKLMQPRRFLVRHRSMAPVRPRRDLVLNSLAKTPPGLLYERWSFSSMDPLQPLVQEPSPVSRAGPWDPLWERQIGTLLLGRWQVSGCDGPVGFEVDALWGGWPRLIHVVDPTRKVRTGRVTTGCSWKVCCGSYAPGSPWRDLPESVSAIGTAWFRRSGRWSIKWSAADLRGDVELIRTLRMPDRRFHHRAGDISTPRGRKKGSEDQALCRSRGKATRHEDPCLAVRGLGCPVRSTLTAVSRGRCAASRRVDRGLPAEAVMARYSL